MADLTSLAQVTWADLTPDIGPWRYSGCAYAVFLTSSDKQEVGVMKANDLSAMRSTDGWATIASVIPVSDIVKALTSKKTSGGSVLSIGCQLSNGDLLYHEFDLATDAWVVSQQQVATVGDVGMPSAYRVVAGVWMDRRSTTGEVLFGGMVTSGNFQLGNYFTNSDGTWHYQSTLGNNNNQIEDVAIAAFTGYPSQENTFLAIAEFNSASPFSHLQFWQPIHSANGDQSLGFNNFIDSGTITVFAGWTTPITMGLNHLLTTEDQQLERFERQTIDFNDTSLTGVSLFAAGATAPPWPHFGLKGRGDRDDFYAVYTTQSGAEMRIMLKQQDNLANSGYWGGLTNPQAPYDVLLSTGVSCENLSFNVNGTSATSGEPLAVEILYRDTAAVLSTGIIVIDIPQNAGLTQGCHHHAKGFCARTGAFSSTISWRRGGTVFTQGG